MRSVGLGATLPLFVAVITTGMACSNSSPDDPVDVAIAVSTTGTVPIITNLTISIDGQDPRVIVIGDTLHLPMSPDTHSFHLVLIPHNCPIIDHPDPYVVDIDRSPSPFPVTFTLTCF